MYKKILVGVALDHSHNDDPALEVARQLADADAKIIALNVVEEIPLVAANQITGEFLIDIPEEFLVDQLANAEADLKERMKDENDVETIVIRGHSGRSIVDYANDHNIDCIVISSHRPGLQDYFLGSTAQRVVRHAHCAVHVLR